MFDEKAVCPVCETEQPIMPGSSKRPAYVSHNAPCGLRCHGAVLAAEVTGEWHGRPSNEPTTAVTATRRHCPRCGTVGHLPTGSN